LTNQNKRKLRAYPSSTLRLYLSVFSGVLSVIFALALLGNLPLLLAYYIILTSFLTVAIFWIKLRSYLRRREPDKAQTQINEQQPVRWRLVFLFFLLIVAMIMSPLLLAKVLPPEIWFILIVGIASGTSLSEIVLYIYCRRQK